MKIYTIIVTMLVLILTACNTQQNAETVEIETTPVSIHLSWVHEYSSSMFHVGISEGIFAANGLDVTIVEGGFGEAGYIDPITATLDDGLEFGLSNGFTMIEARQQGLPIVAIASVLQRSPNAIMSLSDTNIRRPQDLEGNTITIADGGDVLIYSTLVEEQSLDAETINVLPRTSFGVDPLLNGDTDALMAWVINEGVSLEEAGEEPNFIMMSDYGIDVYDFVLFTTEDMIAENPETVQNMVDGLVQSIDFVISNPEEAIKHTLTFNEELDEEAQLRRLQATIPLMNVPNVARASMSAEVWEFQASLLASQGVIDDNFDVTSVYTLDFISTDSEE